MKKFLIVGLGNIGDKYEKTRHNIGFKILDALAENEKIVFETKKLGDISRFRYKGRTFILLKPNTYMNLSGKAVKYWSNIENIPLENILVVADDLNLPFGTIRLKAKGSAGGHNGLTNINEQLQSQNYGRLRFGVGAEFKTGRQVDYVLGEWNQEEQDKISERIDKSTKAITSFALAGMANTMSDFNGK
ncbi:Peptidyl-tRNA hydrolase [hydrothermal vent metagenome]|uniref:peptidyl-tRNA hydrolase n=1 Tax=hydrothermal vent metagenome TaxID=652676 RepID=A0A3B0QZA8_9ZZZZ